MTLKMVPIAVRCAILLVKENALTQIGLIHYHTRLWLYHKSRVIKGLVNKNVWECNSATFVTAHCILFFMKIKLCSVFWIIFYYIALHWYISTEFYSSTMDLKFHCYEFIFQFLCFSLEFIHLLTYIFLKNFINQIWF